MAVSLKNRNRESNYSPTEVELLIDLCNRHKSILENKTTNAITWKQKANVWEQVAISFNAATETQARSSKSLRLKYESLKKDIRKASAKKRKAYIDTGGGPYIPTLIPPSMERLHANIKMSCDGMDSPFDSDSKYLGKHIMDEPECHLMEELIDDPNYSEKTQTGNEIITVDFSDYSASMLQTKKPKELQYTNSATIQSFTVDHDKLNISAEKAPLTQKYDYEKNYLKPPVQKYGITDDIGASLSKETQKNVTVASGENSTSHEKRKMITKRKTTAALTPKYDSLCDLKSQLAEKEIILITNRIQFEKSEYEQRMANLVLEHTLLTLKIRKLKLHFAEE